MPPPSAPKITSNNLSYHSTLPPFLARLRNQIASSSASGGPDPLLAKNRRHGTPRSAAAEAEDCPLVVDERGNVVADVLVGDCGTVVRHVDREAGSDSDLMRGGKRTEMEDGPRKEDEDGNPATPGASMKVGMGMKRKKKIGKVVGQQEGVEDGEANNDSIDTEQKNTAMVETKRPLAKAKKQSHKKIKLSFGDADEDC